MNLYAEIQAITRAHCRAMGYPVPKPTPELAREIYERETEQVGLIHAEPTSVFGRRATVYWNFERTALTIVAVDYIDVAHVSGELSDDWPDLEFHVLALRTVDRLAVRQVLVLEKEPEWDGDEDCEERD